MEKLSHVQLLQLIDNVIFENDQELIQASAHNQLLKSMVGTMFPEVDEEAAHQMGWNALLTYVPGENTYSVHNGLLWRFVSQVERVGVEPGTDDTVWVLVPMAALSHPQNTDFMLGRLSALIGHTGTIDLRTPGLRNMNEFYVFNPSGTGEFTVNLRTAASGTIAGVRHMFTVQIAAGQNFNIRFANTADMYVGSEDAVLTPGHIAYFLGSATSPGGALRTHLLFITDRVGGIPEAPNDAEVYSRGALAWVRGVTKTVYDAFVEHVTNQISDLGTFIAGHEAATTAHSATSAPTASRIILRDAAGRAQVVAPIAAADIARLDTVTGHSDNTVIHITSGERAAWNSKAENLIRLGRLITTNDTIIANDIFSLIEFNSVTNMQISIGTVIPIGGWIEGRIVGAGLPIFVAGANQQVIAHSLIGRQNCVLRRLANNGITEIYNVI